MACGDLTANRAKACKKSIGGVGRVFLFNNLLNPFTVVNGIITAINPLLTVVYEYAIEGDGNNIAESLVSDRNTGTVNTQTSTISLKKIDASTAEQLNQLAYGSSHLVALDRNGIAHAIGIDDGIDWTVAQSTGGAKTEMNGFTLTGVSTTGALSPKFNSETLEDFLALID